MVVSPYSLDLLYIQIFEEIFEYMSSSVSAIISRQTGVMSQLLGFAVTQVKTLNNNVFPMLQNSMSVDCWV